MLTRCARTVAGVVEQGIEHLPQREHRGARIDVDAIDTHVAQFPAGYGGAFENLDLHTGAREIHRGRETRYSGTDDGDTCAAQFKTSFWR